MYEILRAGVDADEFESVFKLRKDVVKPIDTLVDVDRDNFESIFISHADSLVDLYELTIKKIGTGLSPQLPTVMQKLSESLSTGIQLHQRQNL